MMMYDTGNCGFRGLLRVLLALVVGLWVALPANASFPATSDNSCSSGTCNEYSFALGGWHSTVVAAAEAMAAAMTTNPSYSGSGTRSYRVGSVSGLNGVFDMYSGGSWSLGWYSYTATARVVTASYVCPVNSTLSGSSCTCNSGLTQSGNTCVNPCAAVAGMKAGWIQSPHVSGTSLDSSSVNLCDPGSAITDSATCGVTVDYTIAADGVKAGYATFTGSSCNPSVTPPISTTVPPEPGKPAPSPCKPGTFSGTFNGQSVCIEPSGKTPVETKKKTVEDDGTNTVKKETSTVCAAGACNTVTTTTTTNNSTSSVNVTNNTRSEAKSDYCAANPNSTQCSVECQSDTGTVGCAKLSKPVDGELPTSDVDVPTVQVDGLAGFNIGHACPADLTYIIQGKSYSLSFKAACDVAPMVKPVVLLGAALSALFIVYASLVGKTS